MKSLEEILEISKNASSPIYVLCKNGDEKIVESKDYETLATLFKKDWNIVRLINSGVGEVSYKITKNDWKIINLLKNKFNFGFDFSKSNVVYLSFQEFFDEDDYNSRCFITTFDKFNKVEDKVVLKYANVLLAFMRENNIIPDKSGVVQYVNKKIKENKYA